MLSISISFVVAMVLGLVLNDLYFGHAGSGGSSIYGVKVDVFKTGCCSAAVAVVLALVRFWCKYYVARRVYGVFNFCMYIAMVLSCVPVAHMSDNYG